MEWLLTSEQATYDFGGQLVRQLPTGTTISLNGTLGAGKSVLVRGMAAELGIPADQVTSPTYTLWQTYHARQTLHHLDAYRLDSIDEFYEMGGEELFEMEGWKVIEWGDRISAAFPSTHIHILVEVVDQTTRRLILQGHGKLETIEWDGEIEPGPK